MSATTSIEWTEKTWNPVRGCSVISPGCVNCYAMKTAHRFSGAGGPYEGLTKPTKAGPQWTGMVRPVESALLEPLSWRKPARIFVNSMSDLFHEDVPDAFIDRVFAVMAARSVHTFQILTKRPERMRDYMTDPLRHGTVIEAWSRTLPQRANRRTVEHWPLPNVWLGVSVENQHFADERIPLLLQTPAAVRFISAEPLLGSVNLKSHIGGSDTAEDDLGPEDAHCVRCGCVIDEGVSTHECPPGFGPILDWVIVGGESGKGARPFDLMWARSIVQQCQAAGVPVFVKQLGAKPESRVYCTNDGSECDPPHGREQYATNPLDLKNRKGGDPLEWPADLRIREFPTVEARRRHPNTVRT